MVKSLLTVSIHRTWEGDEGESEGKGTGVVRNGLGLAILSGLSMHVFISYSLGFADTYRGFIQSTLENLVKQLHCIVQAYCDEELKDVTAIPRFYRLCNRLELSHKVCDLVILFPFLYMHNFML